MAARSSSETSPHRPSAHIVASLAANLFVPALLSVSSMTVPVWLVILGALVARAQTAATPDLLPRMTEANMGGMTPPFVWTAWTSGRDWVPYVRGGPETEPMVAEAIGPPRCRRLTKTTTKLPTVERKGTSNSNGDGTRPIDLS